MKIRCQWCIYKICYFYAAVTHFVKYKSNCVTTVDIVKMSYEYDVNVSDLNTFSETGFEK